MKTDQGMSRQNTPASIPDMDCGLYRNVHSDDDCSQCGPNEMRGFTKCGCNDGRCDFNTDDEDSEETFITTANGCSGRETNDDELYVDCRRRFIAKEEQTTHYAEILTTKPYSSTVSMSRRTRESDNPILRLHYDQQILLDDSNDGDTRQRGLTQSYDDSSLYENTGTAPHTKIHQCSSDSEIRYANIENTLNNQDPPHHHYENSNSPNKEKQLDKTVSQQGSDTESLYEDIGDVYEVMNAIRPTTTPINIVYTSVDFPARTKTPSPIGSFTSSLSSLDRAEHTRCSSCSTPICPSPIARKGLERPPDLPQRRTVSTKRKQRARSMHFGSADHHHELNEFGMYTGTLVGSCSVMKNSPKAIQYIVSDFLAREKKERSKPVSLEVNNEFLRLSLNCAPWNLLAQNSVDDIGCVTTVSANNKTALGYTISKPGEDTRCYVIHCSDVDTIKEAILSTFKRPDPTLHRWSSMTVLGTPRSSRTRSLPRMGSMSKHELATFGDIVYLGSHKVKKSYLVVNDNITAVLDHTDSKQYTTATIELYRDAIHLKDSKDHILDMHQLEWILSMGLFDEDRRYFGYISSKAYQGSKTRTFCHVFRCTRVGNASRILESIRQACQATFLAKAPDTVQPLRPRLNSNTSSSSEESMSSSSDTMSLGGSTSSTPPDVDGKAEIQARARARPSRLSGLRAVKSSFRSYLEEKRESDIIEEKEEVEVKPAVRELPVHRFNVFYCISTIVSPPLKQKHVKNCLKQYQKSVDKEMKKSAGTNQQAQHYKKVQLVINENGITIIDEVSKTPQAFFERASLSGVQGHPEGKCAFAFSTVVSGNTKHKCHLFLEDKEDINRIISVIQSQTG